VGRKLGFDTYLRRSFDEKTLKTAPQVLPSTLTPYKNKRDAIMPLYRVASDKLEPIKATSFATENLKERNDLQRLLRADISVLGDDLMMISEEFGHWDESSRRIDLLCLDRQARLVVVEIKRTDDGGHMELQAIRYAAMVSGMTLDQTLAAYARTIGGDDAFAKAQNKIHEFLDIENAEEAELLDEVRIILVSADFSTEITTSVMWLNRHGLDITCLRLKPYRMGEEVLIDVAQIIPLPEAADYEIKVRAHAQEIKKVRTARQELYRRFWGQYIERSKPKTDIYANRNTTSDHWLSGGVGRTGFALNSTITEGRARVELYIGMSDEERNQAAFDALKAQRARIEQVFGGPLDWQDLPNRLGCRINIDIDRGWKTPESDWGALQDEMIANVVKLENALREPLKKLPV
jgi:Domain of unknown function (DUF4268)